MRNQVLALPHLGALDLGHPSLLGVKFPQRQLIIRDFGDVLRGCSEQGYAGSMQMNKCHHHLPSLCLPGPPSTMSAAPASNGVFVVIPPSNASGLRPPPAILPTSMCQPPGVLQFEEPLGVQTPRAIQLPDLRPMETFLTEEPKALGVRASPGPLRHVCMQRCQAGREWLQHKSIHHLRGEETIPNT